MSWMVILGWSVAAVVAAALVYAIIAVLVDKDESLEEEQFDAEEFSEFD